MRKNNLVVLMAAAFFLLSSACLVPEAGAVGGVNGAEMAPAEAIVKEPPGAEELLGLARLEKSQRNYGEAIRLYGLARAAAPPEKRAAISVELATVLGWSRDYKRAIEVYAGVLAADPFNRDARLGLARTYGWAKEYEKSKIEYMIVLSEEPGNTEARIGLARVYAWEGTWRKSVDLYGKVLSEDPGNDEARLGLARVLWWSGDIDGSLREAAAIVEADPGNIEAVGLERRLRRERGPELGVELKSSSDSDADKLVTYRLSGYFNISPLLRLNADYSRYNASRYAKEAHADILTIRDSIRVSKELMFVPRLSFVSTGSAIGGADYLTAGLLAHWDFKKDTTAVFSYGRSPLVDTPTLIENDIRVSVYSATVMHHWDEYTASLRADYSGYSDDNSSIGLRGNIAWKVLSAPDVVVGYIPEYKAFSKKTSSGYYNPSEIFSNDLYLTLSGGLYEDAVEYELTGTVGLQSSDSGSDFTSAFRAKVTGRVTRNLSAFAGYKWSRSALESATGFRFEEFRAGLDYLF